MPARPKKQGARRRANNHLVRLRPDQFAAVKALAAKNQRPIT